MRTVYTATLYKGDTVFCKECDKDIAVVEISMFEKDIVTSSNFRFNENYKSKPVDGQALKCCHCGKNPFLLTPTLGFLGAIHVS